MEENYWVHVELFPGTASQYSAKALNELQAIFLHARAGELRSLLSAKASGPDTQRSDALTSETHTFPYTVIEREGLINFIESFKGVFR